MGSAGGAAAAAGELLDVAGTAGMKADAYFVYTNGDITSRNCPGRKV
jgi:hypothetical protein